MFGGISRKIGSEVRPSADHFRSPLKPDIARDRRNVSNGSIATEMDYLDDVRFAPDSDH